MKKFFLGFFAFIGIVVVGLLALLMTIGLTHSDKTQKALPDKMVLTLALDHELRETTPKSSVFDIVGTPYLSLYETIQTLDRARQDRRIVGLAARLDNNKMGLASMQELRSAIDRFERSGKFAYVYIDDLGASSAMSEYWLASQFNQIWLHPIGSIALTGFAVEIPFARELLDKVGIEPELLHQGKYKSFPESVMRNEISPENSEMTSSMLYSIEQGFYHDVGVSRKISSVQMDDFISQAMIPAENALADGLVDSIGYRDEFDSYLEQTTKGAAAIPLENYHTNGVRSVAGDKMALINVHGALTTMPADQAFSDDVVSADLVSGAIRDAAESNDIKAIIIRLDSPGGTPLAADIIRRAIQVATHTKPVIISMSNTAASGGYWMSTAANAIIAQPTTLTGSIGVFGGKFNAEKLFDKLGINWATVSDHDNSDLWSISKPYSDVSRQKIDGMMAYTYQQFIRRVAEGRKMPPDQVEKIAQGRVWTGEQALKIGLVDKLGDLETAVDTAKSMAKISEQRSISLEIFPKPLNPFQQLMKFVKQGIPAPLIGSWMKNNLSAILVNTLQEFSWSNYQIR
jgi:protease-4